MRQALYMDWRTIQVPIRTLALIWIDEIIPDLKKKVNLYLFSLGGTPSRLQGLQPEGVSAQADPIITKSYLKH
jgi:hypothetical protein